jgi:tripartite-type tricarboxylate transporter receptor subunit TctC
MRATADGYTLMVTEAGTVVVNPSLYAQGKLPYDPDKDFAPISGLVRGYMAMLSHPSLPARTVPELLALAKAKPGELSYGTASVGSSPHMSVVLLESLAKVKFAPVHYRGAAPALNDLIGNHINLVSIAPAIALSAMRAGQVRMIGIAAPHRLKELPDVPTFIESGVPGYDTSTWFGLFAPAGTPKEIVTQVHDEVQAILTEPTFRDKYLGPQALEPMIGTVQQFVDDILAERKVWEKVVHEAGIRIE